jgi:hypothetical protein
MPTLGAVEGAKELAHLLILKRVEEEEEEEEGLSAPRLTVGLPNN